MAYTIVLHLPFSSSATASLTSAPMPHSHLRAQKVRECLCGKVIYGDRGSCSAQCGETRDILLKYRVPSGGPQYTTYRREGEERTLFCQSPDSFGPESSRDQLDHPRMRHPAHRFTLDSVMAPDEPEHRMPMMSLSAALASTGSALAEGSSSDIRKSRSFTSMKAFSVMKDRFQGAAKSTARSLGSRPRSPLSTSPTITASWLSEESDDATNVADDDQDWVRASLYEYPGGLVPLAFNGRPLMSRSTTAPNHFLQRARSDMSSTPVVNKLKKSMSAVVLAGKQKAQRRPSGSSSDSPRRPLLRRSSAETPRMTAEPLWRREDGTWNARVEKSNPSIQYEGIGWPIGVDAYAMHASPSVNVYDA